MIKYFFISVCIFIVQDSIGQFTITIIQEGKKCELMNKIAVYGHEPSSYKPIRINDSTLEYRLNDTEPVYSFILLDNVKHGDTNMMSNWNSRMWLTPEIKQRQLIINYDTKTVKLHDVDTGKALNTIHEWDSITEITGKLENPAKFEEEQNIIIPYIEKHPDSYLSLWFFTHSHALYIENADKKLLLFNKLNPVLQKYSDYQDAKNIMDR